MENVACWMPRNHTTVSNCPKVCAMSVADLKGWFELSDRYAVCDSGTPRRVTACEKSVSLRARAGSLSSVSSTNSTRALPAASVPGARTNQVTLSIGPAMPPSSTPWM